MLTHIGSILTAVSSSIILLSVLYEWAYFRYIGFEYFGMMVLGDHISAAMEHIPLNIAVAVGAWGMGMWHTIEAPRSKVGKAVRAALVSDREKSSATESNKDLWFIAIIFGLLFSSSVITGSPIFPFGAMFLYSIFMITFGRPLAFFAAQGWLVEVSIIRLGLLVVLFIMSMGLSEASSDRKASTGLHYVSLQQSDHIIPMRVYRIIQRGIIGRSLETNETTFIPWSNVRTFKREADEHEVPLMCRWFGRGCPDESL